MPCVGQPPPENSLAPRTVVWRWRNLHIRAPRFLGGHLGAVQEGPQEVVGHTESM